jgi:hypothetical protein
MFFDTAVTDPFRKIASRDLKSGVSQPLGELA